MEPIKAEEKPIEPVVSDIPKTKEEWSNLAKTDPGKFAELTQTRMDTIFRQSKEAQEKLVAAETREKNLLVEINKLKQTPPLPAVDPIQPVYQPKVFGNGNYPQTEDEWNDLFIERPTFATDLRNEYLNRNRSVQEEYNKARIEGVKTLITEHSDMYHIEKDVDGKEKLDKDGHPIVMVDPNTGLYAFNSESDKGKIWIQIYNEDPQGWTSLKNAPSLMMAEMERRLRMKGANMVKGQNNQLDTDQSGVAPEGVPPPKSVSHKFDSDEEKAHVDRAVARGTYKSADEYFKLKNDETKGYAEPNRRPDFSKR